MTDPKSGRLRTDKDRRQFGYEQPDAGRESTGGMAMLVLAFLIAGTVLIVVMLSSVSTKAETNAGSDRLSRLSSQPSPTAEMGHKPSLRGSEAVTATMLYLIPETRPSTDDPYSGVHHPIAGRF